MWGLKEDSTKQEPWISDMSHCVDGGFNHYDWGKKIGDVLIWEKKI